MLHIQLNFSPQKIITILTNNNNYYLRLKEYLPKNLLIT